MNYPLEIGNHNVLFITVDSCRYDTAHQAKLPFLNSITNLRKAETSGTYTFPAHCSFFLGILPNLVEGNNTYFNEYTQIWRSGLAKNRSKSVGLYFSEKNIIEYYKKNNYKILGVGGVSFFSNKEGNLLPSLFPEFIYFQKPSDKKSEENIPRTTEQFPFNHVEEIASRFNNKSPYFLFINSVATHVPYDFPTMEVNTDYKNIIKKLYQIDFRKAFDITEDKHLTKTEISILKNAQIASLEWVDSKIQDLLSLLPQNGKPTLLFVCGDHGEEFGENKRYGHGHVHETVTTVPLWCTLVN